MLKLSEIEGIGPKTLEHLKDLNILELKDLLLFLPKRYEDRQKKSFIEDVVNDLSSHYLLKIKVLDHKFLAIPNQKILKIYFTDEQAKYKAVLVIFQYHKSNYQKIFKKNEYFYIYAKFNYQYSELQSSQFEYLSSVSENQENPSSYGIENEGDLFSIIPVYSLSRYLSQKKFRTIIKKTFEKLNQIPLQNILPDQIMDKYAFISRNKLIYTLHFPESFDALKKAQYQFKYYEFFKFVFFIKYQKISTVDHNSALKKDYQWNELLENKFERKLLSNFQFNLTEEQIDVLKVIKKDLLTKKVMYRLLQGEVGCGKTIVSLLAALIPLSNGYQVALMVPSETLAKQHFENIKKYFLNLDISVEILIASLKTSKKKEIQEKLKNASIQLIVGTHILFSDWVEYKQLAFVIIDEQHKFGVNQRLKLLNKNKGIDLLTMSATPIPRTLALHYYSDLDISTIYKKPQASVKTTTFCCFSEEDRINAYKKIKEEIKHGRQAFIICPIIEESEKLDLNSTFLLEKEIHKNLIPDAKIAAFHGKLTPQEKTSIMDLFLNKKIEILISTSILEVGIDIPNANCILIEDAHRFGLAQLHQLRGRVGRGSYDSYCFFVAKEHALTENGKKRLEALLENHSGFKLAEIDLEIRGPGEFLGQQQSGDKQFKLANLIKDQEILIQCQKDIKEILIKDPYLNDLENKNLKKLYHYLLKHYELHLKL